MTTKRWKIKDLIAEHAILEVQDGNHGEKHPTAADYVADGIPFLMARDFKGGELDLHGACKIRKSLGDSLRIGFARPGDVLLTHKGSIGLVAVVPEVPDYVMLTPQVTYYRTNQTKLLNSYLKYAFQSPFFRHQLNSFSTQSTRPYIGITAQKDLQLDIPTLPMQRRIAGILSAYDELMANSERRIRILETIGRALYREWFVHFRFPGSEMLPRIASPLGDIPQGWAVKKLGDTFNTVLGGTPSRVRPEFWDGGTIPWINSSKVNDLRVTTPSELITPFALERSAAKLMPSGTTVLAITGATLGQVSYLELETTANQSVVGIVDPSDLYSEWIYLTVSDRIQAIINHASGGAQQHINKEVVDDVLMVLPPKPLIAEFKRLVGPMFRQQAALLFQTKNLRQTRDLLLPRLLPGQAPLSASVESRTVVASPAISVLSRPTRRASDEFVEAIVISQLVRKLSDSAHPLGRMRYNKVAYFAHRKAEEDVGQQYLKKAAGPYSPWARYGGPEKIAKNNGYVRSSKAGIYEGLVVAEGISKIDQYLLHYPVCAAIDWAVDKFRYRKNDELELLATVDFAALDLLRTDASVTPEGIRRVIASNKDWAAKLTKVTFSKASIAAALQELSQLFPGTFTATQK